MSYIDQALEGVKRSHALVETASEWCSEDGQAWPCDVEIVRRWAVRRHEAALAYAKLLGAGGLKLAQAAAASPEICEDLEIEGGEALAAELASVHAADVESIELDLKLVDRAFTCPVGRCGLPVMAQIHVVPGEMGSTLGTELEFVSTCSHGDLINDDGRYYWVLAGQYMERKRREKLR